MSIFATLIGWIATKLAYVLLVIQGSKIAYRLWGLTFVAGVYVSCVLLFTQTIEQWWSGILLAGDLGMLLGLLFPPMAGTVLGMLITYWTCLIGTRYFASLTKAAVS